jgi:hypothetical protein
MPTARAQEDTEKKAEPPSPAQQFNALMTEHRQAMNAFMAEYQNAKTNEERQKLISEKYPKPDEYAGKFLELMQKYPEEPATQMAASWIMQYASTTPAAETAATMIIEKAKQAPTEPQNLNSLMMIATRTRGESAKAAAELMLQSLEENADDTAMIMPLASIISSGTLPKEVTDKAQKILIDNFVDKDDFAKVVIRIGDPDTLRLIIDKTTNRAVKGNAMYGLARSLLGRPVTANEEGEALLEKIIAEYADVEAYRGTLGPLAEGPLFELRNLQIGMTAPNIEGEDVDGEAFQLKDYRGKVVVLDFWGDW